MVWPGSDQNRNDDHFEEVDGDASEEDEQIRPGDEEFEPEDEDFGDEEEAEDEEEEEEYVDEEEDFDAPARKSSTHNKRKRASGGVADDEDDDFLMAQRLQSEWGGSSGARSSRAGGAQRVTYAEDSDGDEEDEEGDEDDIVYADESEEEDDEEDARPAKRPTLAPPPPALPAVQKTGVLKIKLRLPSPAPALGHGLAPQGGTSVGQGSASMRSASPSMQIGGDSTLAGGTEQEEDAEEEEQFLEWDDDAADAREEAAKRRKRVAPVLLSEEELAALDDEVERVISHRDIEGVAPDPKDPWRTREFYVKWARYSYIHNSWDTYATLSQLGGFKRVLNYCRKIDAEALQRAYLGAEEREEADIRAALEEEIEKEHSQVERIFAERQVPGDDGTAITQYLCKWQGLPYGDVTWETAADVERIGAVPAVEDYHRREEAALQPQRTVDAARRAFAESGERAFTEQPAYLKGGGKLRDYQLDGLNWMVYNWARGVNGILADEMGLGKTVQCASMVGYLSQLQHIGGPFLVVVPLSTVPNWAREFRKWIPDVNALVYVGDTASREVIRHFEFPCRQPTAGRPFKFDVIITTYELALKDAAILRNVRWAYMMVDEAHRLKNDESALYRELSQWTFKSKLLITGTPLQNNIRELWALLHFLQPAKFPSADAFEAAYDLQDPAAVQRLHAVLRPHLLRRVIKDVEKSLPPKNERVLRVPMTPLQKQYYKWILTKNFKELNKHSKGGQVKLLNVIVDLKKCCNHPFLFERGREDYRPTHGDSEDVAERLVVTSGKMVLLDKLLRRLKETGHRVLIFSQMVRQLDIIAEYMRLRGYRHQRLDGSTPAHQRHQAMERFNAPGSEDFAFLLSTRAGGLGINLATADTVLLFDSDWNPQNDLQAMSRAHRIGQKDIVNIYRLVTSGSVEEDILERAKRKMVLDHLVIQKMDTSGRTVLDAGTGSTAAGAKMFNKDELAAILKFGAQDLFTEEDGAAGGSNGADGGGAGLMTDEDLDAILARAEVIEQKDDAPGGASDLLSSFNVATFKADDDDAAFWSRLIPEHMRPKDEPELPADPGIRTARLRALEGTPGVGEHAPGGGPSQGGAKKKKKAAEPGPPVDGALLRIDRWPQAVDSEGRLSMQETSPRPQNFPKTLSRRDATAFVRAVRRRGLVTRLDAIAEETGGAVAAAALDARLALWHGLIRGCEKVVDIHNRRTLTQHGKAGPGPSGSPGGSSSVGASGHPVVALPPGPHGPGPASSSKAHAEGRLDFFGAEVKAAELLSFVRQMALLDARLARLSDPIRQLRLTVHERPAPTAWMRGCGWTPDYDTALLVGAWRHGVGAWDKVADDAELRLGEKLVGAAGREGSTPELPKPSHLETRVLGLLRQIEKVARKPPKPPPKPKLRLGQHGAGPMPHTVVHRPAPNAQQAASAKAAAERAESLLGADVLVLVRKLRTLQRQGADMDPSLVVNKTRKYMATIGKRIDTVAAEPAVRAELWAYVSSYTENAMSGDKLEHVYRRLSDKHEPHNPSQAVGHDAAKEVGPKPEPVAPAAAPEAAAPAIVAPKPEHVPAPAGEDVGDAGLPPLLAAAPAPVKEEATLLGDQTGVVQAPPPPPTLDPQA